MGIFDNQQVQPVGTAVTPADPIPNQAEVTAIRGGQYANPLIQELFTSEGDSSKYDKNEQAKYQTLNNLERTLTDLQDAKVNNRISRDQATQNEIVIAQKFKNDNPHLGKEIDDLIARRKNTYRAYDETTGKGTAVEQKQEQVNADLFATAVNDLKLISPTETDPDKIQNAIMLAQNYTSAKAQLESAQKNINYTQSQLSIKSSEQGLVQQDQNIQKGALELQLAQQQAQGRRAAGALAHVARQSFDPWVDSIHYAIQEANGDPTRLAQITQAIKDHQTQTAKVVSNNPMAEHMPQDMQKQAFWGFDEQYKTLLEEASGKTPADIAGNQLDTVRKTADFQAITTNDLMMKASVARDLLGETAAGTLYSNIKATEFFTGGTLDPVYGQEDTTSSILSDDANAKFIRDIMPDSVKVWAKYNGNPTEAGDKKVLANINTILGSLDKDKIPDTSAGKSDKLKAITQLNKALATEDAGNTFIRLNSRIKPEFKDKYTEISREQYNSPLFLGMRDKFMSLGDPAKFVNVVWQDGGVRIRPNENLSPEDKAKAIEIINRKDTKAYLGLITDAVKADSHIHGNEDYPKKLEGMVADYFMVDPTKNLTPERIQEVASTAPVVNTQQDAENLLVNSYVDSRNAYLDVLKQKIAASSVDDARKQAVIDKIDAGDLSDPLVADPLQQWYTKHKVTPEFVQRIDAAYELQKQTSSPEPTPTPTQNTPQELPQGPTGASRVMGSVRVQGEDITLPNEASVEEFAKAEGFTPAQTEAMLQMWRESVAQKTRALTGERVKKAK